MKILLSLFVVNHATRYPECIERGFRVSTDIERVFIDDIRDFLEEGLTGEITDGKFTVLSSEACSKLCTRLEKCDWWALENGLLCSVYTNNNMNTVSGTRVNNDEVVGHRSCSLSIWPNCLSKNTFVSNIGYSELWINATAILGFPNSHPSCYNYNCHLTDQFSVDSIDACATVCSRYPGCAHFTFGLYNDLNQCWLRRHQFRNDTLLGYVSGDLACASNSLYVWPTPLTEFDYNCFLDICLFCLFSCMADRLLDTPPIEPEPPGPDDCCGEGCKMCVWDIYEANLEKFQSAMEEWKARRTVGELKLSPSTDSPENILTRPNPLGIQRLSFHLRPDILTSILRHIR